jgi:hypothetical protein
VLCGALALALLASPSARALSTSTYQPGFAYFTVPAGVVKVEVTAVGAAGGSGCAAGGRGAAVSTTLHVTPGEELGGEVGSRGEPGPPIEGEAACPGGAGEGALAFGGGGSSPFGGGSAGGGASWLGILPEAVLRGDELLTFSPEWGKDRPLVVAGGGGGGGWPSGAAGGDAGAIGQPGRGAPGLGGRAGAGASAGAGGSGGTGAAGAECVGTGGPGWEGSSGHGGSGGYGESGLVQELGDATAGGGGGGFWGGGGGGGGAKYSSYQPQAQSCRGAGGGGGGSSFSAEGGLTAEPTAEAAHVTVTYEPLPAPTVSIAVPADGASYPLGAAVSAAYGCEDALEAPGVESCEGTSNAAYPGLEKHVSDEVANGSAIDTSYLGTHTFTVLATSKDGLGATATSTYTVLPPASRPTSTPSGEVPAPVISRVSQTHRRWREGGALATVARSAPTPQGTAFKFELNTAAEVRFSFAERPSHGYGPAVLSFEGHPGTNTMTFDGRFSRTKRLAGGEYTVTITASNARGKAASKPLSFTIAK